MPTNLPPDYFNVERRYREATDITEKIALLEEMYSLVPKHKGTDHLRADLRRTLSKLKEEGQERKKHGHVPDYHIEKEGAGQVVVIGPPNTGKSTLVRTLTNAQPEVSQAAFTTRKPVPGMMPVRDIQVQLVDTPSLDRELTEGALYGLVRQSDLVLLVVDLQADPLEQVIDSLDILAEHHLAPQELLSYHDPSERIFGRKVILLINKCDEDQQKADYDACCSLLSELDETNRLALLPRLPFSNLNGFGTENLKETVFNMLEIVRVYARPPGKEPDMERPFVLKRGSTILDLARKVHRDFGDNLKSARVWGSAEFPGQMVHKEYELKDGDVVELRI
jgi:hypothetical protein